MKREPKKQGKSRKDIPVRNDEKTFQNKIEEQKKTVRDIVEKHFPDKYKILETCLSVKALELIDGMTLPFCLILIANPGSAKSTILYIVESLGNCHVTKQFTPKAFVSHMAGRSEEKLREIDLLPKIKNKTLITSELAPIFSTREDHLKEMLGILTSILDGKGYTSESGARGQRGYNENIFFTWLGGVVEISSHVWNLIAFMGPKMYFLRIPEDKSTLDAKRASILKNLTEDYEKKLKEISKNANLFWDIVKSNPFQKDGKILWDETKDNPKTMEKIVMLAQVLACLRAYLPTSNTAGTSGSNYGYEKPIVEDPERASHALYNLAKGHAVLCGRNYITDEDLGVVRDVALSSASRDRVELFLLLIENDGLLSTNEILEKLHIKSNDTALRKMRQLEILGLVEMIEIPSLTKPIFAIKLKEEFEWLLKESLIL